VADAVARGAKVLHGGERPAARGIWFPPTVLAKVDHSMRAMREETFGPLLPIQVVKSLGDAIALANDSEFGLTASAGPARGRRPAAWRRSSRRGR